MKVLAIDLGRTAEHVCAITLIDTITEEVSFGDIIVGDQSDHSFVKRLHEQLNEHILDKNIDVVVLERMYNGYWHAVKVLCGLLGILKFYTYAFTGASIVEIHPATINKYMGAKGLKKGERKAHLRKFFEGHFPDLNMSQDTIDSYVLAKTYINIISGGQIVKKRNKVKRQTKEEGGAEESKGIDAHVCKEVAKKVRDSP